MLQTFQKLTNDKVKDEAQSYVSIALQALGLDWPEKARDLTEDIRENWAETLSAKLKFERTVYRRSG